MYIKQKALIVLSMAMIIFGFGKFYSLTAACNEYMAVTADKTLSYYNIAGNDIKDVKLDSQSHECFSLSNGYFVLFDEDDSRLSIRNADGTEIFSLETSGVIIKVISLSNGSYAVGANIGSHGELFYLNSAGNIQWKHKFADDFQDLAEDSDGSIAAITICGMRYGELMYFNSDGVKEWSHKFEDLPEKVMVDRNNGNINVITLAAKNGELMQFSDNGTKQWTHTFVDQPAFMAMEKDDGGIVVVTKCVGEYQLMYFNTFGIKEWSKDIDSCYSLTTVSDGSIVLEGDNIIYHYDRSGKLHWSKDMGHFIGCIGVLSDGSVAVIAYVDSDNGRLEYFNCSGESKWHKEINVSDGCTVCKVNINSRISKAAGAYI